jgi:hypothetical protein
MEFDDFWNPPQPPDNCDNNGNNDNTPQSLYTLHCYMKRLKVDQLSRVDQFLPNR